MENQVDGKRAFLHYADGVLVRSHQRNGDSPARCRSMSSCSDSDQLLNVKDGSMPHCSESGVEECNSHGGGLLMDGVAIQTGFIGTK